MDMTMACRKSRRALVAAASLAALLLAAAQPAAADYRGLWVGSALLDKVNEINSSTPGVMTDAAFPLELVLILHVSDTGQARLLKEVYQVWRDGVLGADGRVEVPGAEILLVDHRLLPCFKGVAQVDGTPVGRRLSSIGFDFEGLTVAQTSGALGVGGSLQFDVVLSAEHPTNPYLHRYHPDHDNLDEDGATPAPEAPAVTRRIAFSFDGAGADDPPATGSRLLSGDYGETLVGLTRASSPVIMGGRFTLQRVTDLMLTEVCP